MTRKEEAGRHGSTESSGAESWRSQDTVRANSLSGRRRGAPMKVKTDKQQKKDDDDKDNEISPGTATSPEFKTPDFSSHKGPGLQPWERRRAADFSNYRKDLAVLEQAGNGVPSISRVPPTASASTPPWAKSNGSGDMTNSIFSGSFFNDSNEDVTQLSPGFRPGSGQTEEGGYQGEDRRPSVASATTVSSSGSKSSISRGFHKKLQGFFGEEFNGSDSRQNSQTSLPERQRNRNNSLHNTHRSSIGSRPGSPASSRPRTPLPSSEVTPWEYQEKDTPSTSTPADQQSIRSAKGSHSHKLPFHGHRHHRSNDESKAPDLGHGMPLRPVASRDESSSSYRGRTDFSIRSGLASAMTSNIALVPRSSSPTGSTKSNKEPLGSKSPGGPMAGKRSLFDKLRRKDKADRGVDGLKFPSIHTLAATNNEANKCHEALWNLDTDLSHMEGIINPQQPPMTPPMGDIYAGWPDDTAPPGKEREQEEKGVWDAPDSWAVKRANDENVSRLQELDEQGNPQKEEVDPGPPFCVRIFRVDSTFAVLSVPVNTTVGEVIQILGKKSFLQDELGNYQIIMRKHDTSRQLEPNERPLVIQKRLLEQAGYSESDRLEDVGREDNSYLCRFTFLPAKMSGYSSLEKDPGFSKMQKFSHIDLQGRNLITIPITLYQKATEIISLNLSRNLSLDIPKDFIQACTNLREIKYTSNEAWRLPPSLSLATRLTMLDISNNRLEQLEHADLWKLHGLLSLRLSNNKLTHLPEYFGSYRALRSLNLSSNSLTEFPDFLGDIQTLVDLDVSFNSIESLPKIGQLVCLERLWATNNKLRGSFPDDLKNLSNLKEIDVRFNAIDSIDVMSQLPRLEYLMVGHNSISAFEGSFAKIRVLHLNHNPVTRFGLSGPVTTLSMLNLASAKLTQLPDDLFLKVPNLTKLILDKNHFVSLSPQMGKLSKLEHLSLARNNIDRLPADIGRLCELRYLDVRENNLNALPQEIWYARKLETLNISSNVLETFPKPGPPNPTFQPADSQVDGTPGTAQTTPGLSSSPSFEDLGKLEDFEARRPSQNSGQGLLTVSSSPGAQRSVTRKDSSLSNRMVSTFAGSLRHLFLADNRLNDDVFDELALLPELRILNISWQHITEFYLSGNDLTSLPAEDLEEVTSLRILHINGNKFQVLPAELGKVAKLAILDVGSNALKYNVSNWPYDWNWNWNHNLRYLNLSGNKRLEIKPHGGFAGAGGYGREGKDLTDFTSLTNLRILGVRTAGSMVGTMSYGLADTLGRNEHLSTMDLALPAGGSKIAKYLYDHFKNRFSDELERLRTNETPADALRRSYLGLNKDLAEDLHSGSVATVVYLKEMELYVSNVEPSERTRIRDAGGFMCPSVIAAPHVSHITLRESDEMILVASRELWDYLTPDFAVDVARSERGDLMRAAQKLRDLAIAFGATGKIMVMLIGVSDLRKRERARFRTHSMSMGPTGSPDELFPFPRSRGKRREVVGDQKLARLDSEVDAPTGEVSLVFTDIKNSTLMWETYPTAMRSAIKMHNDVMRRQLRIIGGYEVKTEGDAFMVAFPTWPQEILNSVNGQEVADADGNIIFRGLSVRMGIHWGTPVCEVDPVTKRMDYFGPMVNRASRISSVADGGQITVSSDFIAEIQRLLETHIESDRSGSVDESLGDDAQAQAIRRELRSLSSQGFEVKDLGERRLKGLENPEYIYLMYPHSLASRLVVQQQRAEAEAAANTAMAGTKMPDSQLTINTEDVWALWNVSLRLEMLCSALESPGSTQLKAPETALLERMKTRGGEITDRFLINFVEHQISRIESCITTLQLRHTVRPFGYGMLQQACPMDDIFAELSSQLEELRLLKATAAA
ncbi:Adenylate cyclase [Lasiodiplodia theobromae]|uniref:Adenylate cyclase n=1 Tax=Lasiodiplodia theobromae TaxID=45133 RepID=UPI0015C389DF|nr:Adenylate cyclase [Lasiodiplodia theobromae]KAF4540959.1 Adenylate cyclase [Lasiodiplodia theobromae]